MKILNEMATRVPHCMNRWEHTFAPSLDHWFYQNGNLTRKQLAKARDIVNRIATTLAEVHRRPDLIEPTPENPTSPNA